MLSNKKPNLLKIPTAASNIVYLKIFLNVIVKEFGKVVHNTKIFQKDQHQLKLQERENSFVNIYIYIYIYIYIHVYIHIYIHI